MQQPNKMKKPVAAVFLFCDAKLSEYKSSFPKMNETELRKVMVADYNKLSQKEKERYIQKETQLREEAK